MSLEKGKPLDLIFRAKRFWLLLPVKRCHYFGYQEDSLCNKSLRSWGTGAIQVSEVPCPALNIGRLLVKNHYPLVSACTEGSTAKTDRKDYIGKYEEESTASSKD